MTIDNKNDDKYAKYIPELGIKLIDYDKKVEDDRKGLYNHIKKNPVAELGVIVALNDLKTLQKLYALEISTTSKKVRKRIAKDILKLEKSMELARQKAKDFKYLNEVEDTNDG
jgi:ribonuclease HI